LLGRETIYRDGWLTSGGFGYTVDKSIGYGYVRSLAGVDREYLRSGTYELEVASRRVPASIHFASLYDPDNERIRS
jgi:4-methylaminobutanoate oxidase (formaldehyde-forming)